MGRLMNDDELDDGDGDSRSRLVLLLLPYGGVAMDVLLFGLAAMMMTAVVMAKATTEAVSPHLSNEATEHDDYVIDQQQQQPPTRRSTFCVVEPCFSGRRF